MRQTQGVAHPRSARTGITLAACLAASTAWTGAAHAQFVARATLISPGDGSHAFNSAAFARVPVNLAAAGYAEKEYFLSGLAKAYAYNNPSSATDDSVSPVQAGPVPYVNRILVRAPSDPAKFSGNVIVEIANDALISDNETAWPYANSQFIANGDAYILLTSQPAGLQTLKAFAPNRYRALSWPTVAATKNACNAGAEGGLIYDQVTELGNLLKSNGSTGPLTGYSVKHLFLTGYSAGASILLSYNRVFGVNSPLYDAYFVAAGGFRNALNGCEASSVSTAKAEPPASTVSAVFQTQTLSELAAGHLRSTTIPKATDSNTATNRYRYYEIAGSAHVNGDLLAHSPQRSDFPNVAGVNYLTNVTEAQAKSECNEPASSILTSFPSRYVYDAMWANLEKWVANGTAYSPPSEASAFDIADYTNAEEFDFAFGTNGALPQTGGVRSPAVDFPINNYFGGTIISSSQPVALQTFCALTGSQTANGSTANRGSIITDAQGLAAAGFLTPADENAIIASPNLAYTFPDGTTSVPN